jgi:hypothetical protein
VLRIIISAGLAFFLAAVFSADLKAYIQPFLPVKEPAVFVIFYALLLLLFVKLPFGRAPKDREEPTSGANIGGVYSSRSIGGSLIDPLYDPLEETIEKHRKKSDPEYWGIKDDLS